MESLIFSIAVHGAPESSSHQSAQRFIAAALAAGHKIYRVFFYHDAVTIAISPTADERPLADCARHWQDLKSVHDLELCVCIGAASRRGVIVNSVDAPPPDRTDSAFEIVGLGQLIDAMVACDRFITFSA